MPAFLNRRRGSATSRYRVFFATDVHGSERCFRKFLAAAKVYEADALVLGGDVAGKAIVPIIHNGDGRYEVRYQGAGSIADEEDLSSAMSQFKDGGLYPMVVDEAEVARLEDVGYRDQVFEAEITGQLAEWCALAAERLDDRVRCVITPGNDDLYAIDSVLEAAERIECPERSLLELGPVTLASLGNANRTPWDTEREFDEAELATQIDEMLRQASSEAQLVFNFHVPPYGSGLDTAMKLDSDLRPVVAGGHTVQIPVGSTAVLEAIDRYQPVVGLHGHIHESAGAWKRGRTMCLNPGSDYGSGVLKGVLVQFDGRGKYDAHILTTG
jgi:Icc-related predicted phosphoesterase